MFYKKFSITESYYLNFDVSEIFFIECNLFKENIHTFIPYTDTKGNFNLTRIIAKFSNQLRQSNQHN